MKKLNIVVLAKQVPDTRNVGKDAMTAEGTVNRAALAAIFNPEDLNALEMALALKSQIPGTTVHVLTMGPERAEEILRDSIFRGADGGTLLSGREFAGADTLATSYALTCALKKLNPDLVVAGRQAIDGDTAQVGPQVAGKMDLPQVTYAEEVVEIKESTLVIKRRLERGVETVECPVPAVITVNGTAPDCRPKNARRVMRYKNMPLTVWGAADVDPDMDQLGLNGSPTKVKKIENVVFRAKECKRMTGTDTEIEGMMKELIASHTIG